MGKALDIIGKRFGHFFVLRQFNKRKCGEIQWVCSCDCGRVLIRRGSVLKKNKHGCLDCRRKLKPPFKKAEEINGVVEVTYESKKHGDSTVFIDAVDFDKIKHIRWFIKKDRNTLYAQAQVFKNGKKISVYMHRFILDIVGERMIVDHADRNGLNNTRINLRVATSAQNRANSVIPKTNTTGFKGVWYNKTSRLYVCYLIADGISYYGGGFKNILLAAKKYNELAIKYCGEFACLNKFTKEQEIELSKIGVEKRRPKPNKYGYIGVGVDNDRPNKYKAVISIDKKVVKLGNYATAIEAARAYDYAAKKYYGESKPINGV